MATERWTRGEQWIERIESVAHFEHRTDAADWSAGLRMRLASRAAVALGAP